MNRAAPVVQSGAFVRGNPGSRFRLVSEPAAVTSARGTVIFVSGFAEEMNKARRMAARMARLLAGDGWRVVQRDLSGCGDSSGDFGSASWDDWRDDVAAELAEADSDRPVWLWCLRAGALLAPAALAARPDANLLLWQPVLSGAQHLRQFLRLHAGARVVGSDRAAGTAMPAQALGAGSAVEVGGYALSPALATALEAATFDVPAAFAGRIVWFETSVDDPPALTPAAAAAIGPLRERGVKVAASALAGPPFWQTAEIEECDLLLARTLASLQVDAAAVTPGDPRGLPRRAGSSRYDSTGDDERAGEKVLAFGGSQGRLWGILAGVPAGMRPASTAVVILVGGPQYRVGSHRQFVQMARRWASAGFATLRFDYAGMGDSEGERATFETCGRDLGAAIDALLAACPEVSRIAVWGLCDGASAALMLAAGDPRVAAVVAANPWVRSDASLAATRVRHYYLGRVTERQFWAKLLRGGVDWRASLSSFATDLKGARAVAPSSSRDDSFQARMARGLAGFRGRVLLILSGNDLTAKEFLHHAGSSPAWHGLLDDPKVSRVDLAGADHTFSQRSALTDVEDRTLSWLRRLDDSPARTAANATEARVS